MLQVIPKQAINIRAGRMDDIPFMDALQKKHSKQVGWMPMKQLEGKIAAGHVLVAEEGASETRNGESAEGGLSSVPHSAFRVPRSPIGYCIGNDQYFKRDDVGIIYQLNVMPDRQRGLVGAALLKAQFERSAYGCKLYCCWCAQDIAANRFWEAMGFVPLAFRAGSAQKSRVHIFWQKRIRAGDDVTPWWFPSQTSGGSIREDRIVLPIPPGTHWSDAKPMILPHAEGQGTRGETSASLVEPGREKKQLTGSSNRKSQIGNRKFSAAPPVRRNGLWFGAPKQSESTVEKTKKEKPRRIKHKNDPRVIAAARELRDRWLEKVNAGQYVLHGAAKYDVGLLANTMRGETIGLLPAPLDMRAA